ncbi:TetR/AcrR family transcriptional regulator [Desulfovibrio ferrophilus]|uniref:Transcriptional regulator, TetR family n=1 Tax=Desulfovibrio ferrophilus TaxID=241368 RepID=A0A2Z6B1E7_9BACT|nr:TetR/AcrR family transcriptional regulator [Desulfovibrio ferrophilus]BBD09283.1 transcriptional regulator, TetR family [Desulfovibrio ferrophilus]
MKISQEKKIENRQAIIQSAVELVIEKGLKAATMRGIARGAGCGDATIYNYFPTKEAILYAYYEDRFTAAVSDYEGIDGLAEYTLQERLQAFFEVFLDGCLADREFLQATFKDIFFSMPPNPKALRPVRECFFGIVNQAFEAAQGNGELEEQMFGDLLARFFWDYFLGIVAYWLRDDSEQFAATSSLIDKTMGLACAMIKAGVVSKVYDICTFLFRNHVLAHLETCKYGIDALENITKVLKEEFNERPDTQG